MKSLASRFIVFLLLGLTMYACNANNINTPLISERDCLGKTKYDMWQKINSIETKNKTYVVATGNNQHYRMFVDSLHQDKPVPEKFLLAKSWRWHDSFHIYLFNFDKQGIVSSLKIDALP